jgi:hypothetical protein
MELVCGLMLNYKLNPDPDSYLDRDRDSKRHYKCRLAGVSPAFCGNLKNRLKS